MHVERKPPAEIRDLAGGASEPLPAASTVVFHHIPKTAGTAVRTAFCNMFGEVNCVQMREIDFMSLEPIRAAVQGNGEPRLVSGHIPLRYVDPAWGARAVTFLRDPIDRVLSLHRFIRSHPPKSYAHTGLREGFSLREFLNCRHPEITSQIDNGMCRFLARDNSGWPIDAADAGAFRPNVTTLYSAVEELNRMTLGICERMEESLALMSRVWGMPYELSVHTENVSPSLFEEHVADELAEIAARNALDVAFYRIGLDRFAEQLRLAHRAERPLVPTPSFAPGREYRIDALPARDGFYAFEADALVSYLPAGGIARIRFQEDEHPVEGLSLRVYAGGHGFPVERTSFLLNGAQVALDWRMEADGAWGTAFLGPFNCAPGMNVLEIHPPKDAGTKPSLDPRSLAFGISTLRVR